MGHRLERCNLFAIRPSLFTPLQNSLLQNFSARARSAHAHAGCPLSSCSSLSPPPPRSCSSPAATHHSAPPAHTAAAMPSPSRRRLVFAQSSRLAVAAEFRAVETTFATYTVTATEAGREWRHPVRWSDLRRLHDELQRAFGEALKKQDIPTFRPHTLRLGSARLSPSFLAARASEMQSYLSALVEALGVSLVDGTGPAVLRAFLAQGCDVEQPTPIDRWYTPEAGWPGVAWAGEERLAPCSLTPTGLAATALPDEILGELRVEILQATGLERSDLYSQNDVYARSSCTAQRSLALSLALSP